jgi:WD40 repeat protein
MNREFNVLPISHTSDQRFDSLQKGFDALIHSVTRLKAEVCDLERLKNLATIHSHQNEIELETLNHIYKTLKTRLEFLTQQPARPIPRPVPSLKTEISWGVTSSFPFFKQSHVRLRYSLRADTILCTVRFNRDGTLFTFTDGNVIFLVSTADGTVQTTIPIPRAGDQLPRASCFSPDSAFLAIGGQTSATIVVDVAKRQIHKILEVREHVVSAIGFFHDAQRMITGGFDGKLCLWSVPDFKQLRTIQHGVEGSPNKEDMVVSIAFSSDDEFIAVGFMSGTIGIYEPTFQQPMSSFQAHSALLLNVVISNSDVIATASQDKTAKLWVIRGVASCKQVLQGHSDFVLAIAFSPRESVVFTGSKDETIKGWNQKTGEMMFTLTGHKNTLFQIDHHPLERTIVSCGGDGLVCAWDYDLP